MASTSQAPAGGARGGFSSGARPSGPRPAFEQPMHKIWGRLEDVSVGDGSGSGSSEQMQQVAARLEGVQVEDSWDTSQSNSGERIAGVGSGWQPPGARAGPRSAVQEGRSCGIRAAAGSTTTEVEVNRVSRQARAMAIFGPMGVGEIAANVQQDPRLPCYDRELHDSGQCRPCHYFVKKGGCVEKDECKFCHLEHEATRRLRPCKVKRERCKSMAGSLASENAEIMQRMGEISERSSLQGSYMRTIMATQAKTGCFSKGSGADSEGGDSEHIAI